MFDFLKKKPRPLPEPISEKEERNLMLEFAEAIGDISEYKIEPELEDKLFEELANVDYLHEYLKATIARDMQRYFAATDEMQRNLIKGQIARVSTLRAKVVNRPENKVVESKMMGLRYNRR